MTNIKETLSGTVQITLLFHIIPLVQRCCYRPLRSPYTGYTQRYYRSCLDILRMNNSAWKIARKKVGLQVRIHDLKHTFGRRLRAAGVSFEDWQDLLGHKSGRVTTHYSSAEMSNLIEAANKVYRHQGSTPTLTLLKCLQKSPTISSPRENLKLRIVS